jgi:hypothetical protein
MAAKKPAKKNITTMTVKEKVLPGKAVKYFGSKTAPPFTCPICSRTLIKGIIYEEFNTLYCSRTCIPKPQ